VSDFEVGRCGRVVVGDGLAGRVKELLLLVGHGQVPGLGLHERRMLAIYNDNSVQVRGLGVLVRPWLELSGYTARVRSCINMLLGFAVAN